MPKKSEIPIDFKTLEFWDMVESLLSDAGRYAHSFKLLENLNDSSTRFKVEHVLLRYYDGNERKLRDDVRFRRNQCFKSISQINQFCDRQGIYKIKDKEALTNLLLDEKRRSGWKKLIKRFRNNNEIITLQKLELEYRKTPKAPKKAP